MLQRNFFGDVASGYHIVSVVLHGKVFILAISVLLSQLQGSNRQNPGALLTFTAVLMIALWAMSPINSQAVVYVAQQYVLWCALFSLLSLITLIKAYNGHRRILMTVLTLTFWILAVKSKQTALFLPLIYICYTLIFHKRFSDHMRLLLAGLLLGVTLLIIASIQVPTIDQITRETLAVPRLEYIKAQSVILWSYWELVFWPDPLVLDYGIRENIFSDVQVAIASIAHLFVISGAILVARKLPFLTLAVLSFYILHIVESSFVPIQDFKLEHRMYLPSLFFTIFLSIQIIKLLPKQWLKVVAPTLTVVVLLQGYVVHQRIDAWSEPEQFYQQELQNSYQKFWRTENQLGALYLEKGQYQRAAEIFTKLLQDKTVPNNEAILLNAVAAFSGLERWAIVERLENMIIPHFSQLTAINKSRLLINRAIRFAANGDCDSAIQSYEESKRYSEYTEAHEVRLPGCL
ncbi:tetratricopeptide repeat protein [Idiomarina aquatica]|nr:hypothetical protein [Idiomarina aquatica]